MKLNFILILFFSISLIACQPDKYVDDKLSDNETISYEIPKGFPYPKVPQDNLPTKKRIELGEKLFFDPILSRDSSISCGSCHFPNLAFADGLPKSIGIDGRIAKRNAPSLLNAAYLPAMFWDGGVPTLEQQILAPIENPDEMDFDINKVVARLNKNAEYKLLFEEAYNLPPSVFSLTRAIACYERSLFSKESRFDDYQNNKNKSALTQSEINGMELFMGERGECFHCHGTYNFTEHGLFNNGLYLNYVDSGRAGITLLAKDVGKFKVPTLRNIAKTAPYMHDGSIKSLEDVVEHYNSGGQKHPNKSGLIQPLSLSNQEKEDLVNFLKALNDK